MTLSHEIMKTDPKGRFWSYVAICADVTQMDEVQLSRYVKKTFKGQYDLDFLPRPFWGTYHDSKYLGLGDGRSAGGSSEFFADLYVQIGKMERRGEHSFKSSLGNKTYEYPVDLGYRARLRGTLHAILDECQQPERKPTAEYLRMGLFAIDTVENIYLSDGPDSLTEQFVKFLEEKGEMSMDEVRETIQNIEVAMPKPPTEMEELLRKSAILSSNPAYRKVFQKIRKANGYLYNIPELS